MNAEHATPEVIDALASIETQRQEKEKESGVPVSCNWALGKLYELLPGERKSPGTEIVRTAPGRAEIAGDGCGHGAPGKHRRRDYGDRAAEGTGPDYGPARGAEGRATVAPAKVLARCAKKILRGPAAKDDERPLDRVETVLRP